MRVAVSPAEKPVKLQVKSVSELTVTVFIPEAFSEERSPFEIDITVSKSVAMDNSQDKFSAGAIRAVASEAVSAELEIVIGDDPA